MTLEQLANFLFWWAITLNIITLIVMIGFFWRTRYRKEIYLEDVDIPLRYFIQPEVDRHENIIGYACLLRQQDKDGNWTVPSNYNALPLRRVISLLEETVANVPTEDKVLSINLTYGQFMSRDFKYFIRWAITKIEPMQLSVALPSKELDGRINRHRLKRQIQIGRNYGMKFAINNVGSELNDLKRVEWLLPKVDVLRATMSSFRKKDASDWLDLNLNFWNKLAKKNQIKLVLVGIETETDEKLAELLNINARQGYLFGRPQNIQRK